MKTQNKQLLIKWPALLFSILIILTMGTSALAQDQGGSKQNTDLLSLPMEDLMNIEVASTATLTKTTPRLVPSAMTIITAEQIQSSGARSLNELLDIYVPDLQVIRHHWEGDHIGLRGILGENKYLLLVNGRVMNERTHEGVISERDLVVLSDIHHIDIVRGPGSALYGPGAVSMVINIVTYGPDTFQGTETTSRLGAVEEFYSTELKHGQKFDDNDGGFFTYAGVGKYVGASKYDAPQIFPFTFPSQSDYYWWNPAWGPENDPAHIPSDGTQAGHPMTGEPMNRDGADARNLPELKMYTQIKRDNWDIWARYTSGGKQFNYAPGMWAREGYGYADSVFYRADGVTPKDVGINFYNYQQMTGYVGYKQELTDNLDIDYAFSYELFNFVEYRQNAIDDAYREDEYYGKILSQWQPNDQHKIAFGGEISHRELGLPGIGWPGGDPVSQRLNPMPRWSTDMYSMLGEHQWTINDKWTTFIGARLDDHTYTRWMFSPRAAIVHTPDERDTYKLMWSQSVRATTEEEMKSKALTTGESSEPEKLDSIELRYERQQSRNLDLAASVFVHYEFALVDWSQTAHATEPVGTQRDYGLEFEATYHNEKDRLSISHSYTKLYSFSLKDPCNITFVTAEPYGYGDDLAAWSNHITKLTFQHKLDDKWTFDASLRIYWGFPGMKDYDQYNPYSFPAGSGYNGDGTPIMDYKGDWYGPHRFIQQGWEKAYRGDYYLNLGLQYKPSKNLTIGVTGYDLLGIFNRDLNKRNYLASSGDYRDYAPAIGVSLTYKF
ncbi:MAG: TonB-dependent receptor plug domain-containing protein [Sedimentisphaerales bacterium]